MLQIFKKSIFILAFALLGFNSLAQSGGLNNKTLNLYLDAENAFMAEDYSAAFPLYQEVLKTDPEFDPAMFQLARIYLMQNQLEPAYQLAKKAYELDPKNKWYALLLIDMHKHFNKIEESIEVYKNLLVLDPTNSDYLSDLAMLYTLTQNTQEALALYNQIEKQEGIGERISFIKRDIYLNSDQFDSAVLELVKLADANPQNAQYYSMIAEMYMNKGEKEKAFPYYQKVLDVNPNDPYIRITLADYYQQKGEIDAAFANLQQGYTNPNLDLDTKIQVMMGLFEIKNIPSERIRSESLKLGKTLATVHADKPGAHAIYADLLYRDSLYLEAAQEYTKVIKLDSSRYVVWEQLLFSLNNRTQTKEMVNISRRAMNLFPKEAVPYLFNAVGLFLQDSIKQVIKTLETGMPFVQNAKLMEQFYMYLGDAYYQDNQSEKAFETYDKCLEINPSNTFVLNNYAYYLALKKTRLDKAKTMAFTAISLDPGATNLDTYGWVFYQLGDYQEAYNYIKKALSLDKEQSAAVLDHMGDVYFRLGNPKKAQNYWKKAKKKGLDTPELKLKMANGLQND